MTTANRGVQVSFAENLFSMLSRRFFYVVNSGAAGQRARMRVWFVDGGSWLLSLSSVVCRVSNLAYEMLFYDLAHSAELCMHYTMYSL